MSYADFEAWILANLGPRPSEHHSLDRIDNNGNYEPGNLRWATHQEQMNNRRTTLARVVELEARIAELEAELARYRDRAA